MATDLTIDRLKAQLLTSGLSQKDQPLFQVINQLIDYIRNTQGAINTLTGGGGGGGGSLLTMPFLTYEDVQATLPNSRQLTRQTGISFNKTPQKLIISTELLDYNKEPDYDMGPPGPPGLQGPSGPMGLMGPPGFDSCCDELETTFTPTPFPSSFVYTTTYGVQWLSTGVAPALGTGSLIGRYTRHNNVVFYSITLVFSATTTFGTGANFFTLPFPPVTGESITMTQGLIGGARYSGMGLHSSNAGGSGFPGVVLFTIASPAALWSATVPAVWGTNDQLNATGFFIA